MPLTGRVLSPGDFGWDDACKGFNKRLDPQYKAEEPQKIVFCQDKDDVANAVKWAVDHNPQIPIRVRSGRHHYEGYSSRVEGGLIIDVSEMDSMKVDGGGPGTVVVGPGKEMMNFVQALWEHGRTIPLATGASVGIAGLALGGGFGVTSRKFGLTCDNLFSLEMVTATGEVITASAAEHKDLFWACRGGGGGNFGVVTSMTFRTYPVSYVAVFNIAWPWDHFDRLVDRWQQWAPRVNNGISSILRLSVDRTVKKEKKDGEVRLFGQFTPDANAAPRMSDLDVLLGPMRNEADPHYVSMQVVPFIAAARAFSGLDPLRPHWSVQVHSKQEIGKSTSSLAYKPFNSAARNTLKDWLEKVPLLSTPPVTTWLGDPPELPAALPEPTSVQLLAGGGAVKDFPEDTAVFHRGVEFIVQYNSFWIAESDRDPTVQWVRDFRREMLRLEYTRGAYVNYQDEDIPASDRGEAYYGADYYAQLRKVKKEYDPSDVFKFPQSIPLP